MPRKVEALETRIVKHFAEAPLMVAQAQLAMLQAMVGRRAETSGPTHRPGKGPVAATATVVHQPPPNPGGQQASAGKKRGAAGAAKGVGPASTAPGGPAHTDDPGPHTGQLG